MLNYKSLLDLLAARNLAKAQAFSLLIGGRRELEQEIDHAWDRSFGYALKYIVLGESESARASIDQMREAEHSKRMPAGLTGYDTFLQSILDVDEAQANFAFHRMRTGHDKLSVGRGLWAYREDSLLYVWGIALLNLARHFGINVDAFDGLVPAELVG